MEDNYFKRRGNGLNLVGSKSTTEQGKIRQQQPTDEPVQPTNHAPNMPEMELDTTESSVRNEGVLNNNKATK